MVIPQDLASSSKAVNQELEHFTNSFDSLRGAQAKFNACINSVREIKEDNKGKLMLFIMTHSDIMPHLAKPILVPLTNSLYVPGKLTNAENVLVDVGTGYYVKKVLAISSESYFLPLIVN